MISSPNDAHPVEALAADFVARRRRGERPTVDQYAADHPELAEAIRELFPTIEVLEDVRGQQQAAPDGLQLRRRKKLTRLGDFRVVREIGRGGMGIVYEAVQESLGRRVALKVLATRSPLDDKDRRRFLREARTAGRLHHTNIVPILGVGEQEGFDFYVMQYIDGVGLDAVLSQLRDSDLLDPGGVRLSSFWRTSASHPTGRPPKSALPQPESTGEAGDEGGPSPSASQGAAPGSHPAIGGTQPLRHLCRTYWHDIALVGLQVAEALDYAHGQGTLHRDIKPANLLVDRHGTTWVADFGLAKGIEHEALSRTGEVLGTLLYMAPEQWRGTADARSDIYSLGVTLYELLTLRLPCQLRDRMQALGPAFSHPARLAPAIVPPRKIVGSLPVDLETIVMTAMAEEPAHRYQTAGDLAADLARFLDDRPISVRRPTLRERWSRWRRRNPAAAALSVVAAMLAVLVALVLLVAYVQTRAALVRESSERQRAEETLATSLVTLENVFRHLVPDQVGQTRALAISADGNAALSAGTQPVVSPEAAALLEDLRNVYDKLASDGGSSLNLRLDAARATRRLGDIYNRLGNFDRAETAYRQALEKYESLQSQDATGRARLERARLHNDLGTIYGRKPDEAKSQAEHRLALALLEENSADATPPGTDTRFELARTFYLSGRGLDRASNPGISERDPRQPGPPANRRRPGHRPPPREDRQDFGPPSDREPSSAGLSHASPTRAQDISRAVALLDPLVKEDPKNPAYRYLLAQCYREQAGSAAGPLPEIEKAEQLLKTLVRDYPHVADYRFELADTCAMLDVRELPPEDFPRAEQRLRAALEQSADLVDGHPYAPDYISLHIHVLHKLALILRDTPPNGRDGDRSRMDEAGQLYQEAIRRQAALVKRFPENAGYHFWLATIRASCAQFLLERRQPAEARTLLETAVAESEKFHNAHSDVKSLPRVLHQLYAGLAEARERLDDETGARQARQMAEKFGPPLPPHRRENAGPPEGRDNDGPPGRRRPPPRGPAGPPPDGPE